MHGEDVRTPYIPDLWGCSRGFVRMHDIRDIGRMHDIRDVGCADGMFRGFPELSASNIAKFFFH